MDRKLLILLRTRGHDDPRVEQAIAAFSRAGEHAALWFAIGALGATLSKPGSKRNRAWKRGIAVTAIAYGLNTAVKYAIKRPRPELDDLPQLTPTVTALSFPSAHATTSFAAAAAYGRALPVAAPVFYGTATLLAVSRPYLGVHYPSDVLVGAAAGTVIGRTLRCR